MHRTHAVRRASLVLGVTVAACGLASVEASAQAMRFSQISGITGQIDTGVGTIPLFDPGPTSYMSLNYVLPGPYGPVSLDQRAEGGMWMGVQVDRVWFSLDYPLQLAAAGQGSFVMTFSVPVVWQEMPAASVSWTLDGVALGDGQRLEAGSYAFGWDLASFATHVAFGGRFARDAGVGIGVPLPGAAGLAAVAFAGVAGRRRR